LGVAIVAAVAASSALVRAGVLVGLPTRRAQGTRVEVTLRPAWSWWSASSTSVRYMVVCGWFSPRAYERALALGRE
jgi:hypothetical protein